MLKAWIARDDLGGGIPFSGADLHPAQELIFATTNNDDILTLSDRFEENDSFSRFLAGPVFHWSEKSWRKIKVRMTCYRKFFEKAQQSRLSSTTPSGTSLHNQAISATRTPKLLGAFTYSGLPWLP